MPITENAVEQTYEIFFRHFSPWGEIEDLNILPNNGEAYLKFLHRCMAEFAKEAMSY